MKKKSISGVFNNENSRFQLPHNRGHEQADQSHSDAEMHPARDISL